MCIIVYKPMGNNYPSKKTLKQCFSSNPDGAGYMYSHEGIVHIKKGFMSFASFYKALKQTRAEIGDNAPCVMHFRISTQAGTRKDCTHPYPLSKNIDELRKLKSDCKIGIAHNGIISLTSSYSKLSTHNDTMEFITDYLSLIIKCERDLEDQDKITLIKRLANGNRFAILTSSGDCKLIGDGWREDDGIFYSNGSYIAPKYTIIKSSNIIDDWDEYGDACDAGYYDDKWDAFYNDETNLFDFDMLDCPAVKDGDESYCEVCRHYYKCYATLLKDGEIDGELYGGDIY